MFKLLLSVVVAFSLVTMGLAADQKNQQQTAAAKNQMVKGTVKSVDASRGLLIVEQKVGDKTVIREFDIKDSTAVSVTHNGQTKNDFGKFALSLPGVKEGASVQVKCDKDVNATSVKISSK
jgi:Cu/Ag efflux protein CusF